MYKVRHAHAALCASELFTQVTLLNLSMVVALCTKHPVLSIHISTPSNPNKG